MKMATRKILILATASLALAARGQQRTLGDGYPILTPADQGAYWEVWHYGAKSNQVRDSRNRTLAELTLRYTKWCAYGGMTKLVVSPQGIPQCEIKARK